jgi:hypothetical protein
MPILVWVGGSGAALALIAFTLSIFWTMFPMNQFGEALVLKSGQVSYVFASEAQKQVLLPKVGGTLESRWLWHRAPRQTPMEWAVLPSVYRTANRARGEFVVPLLPVAAVFSGLMGWGFQRAHRMRAWRGEHCGRCGYSRSGLAAEAACPECGNKR